MAYPIWQVRTVRKLTLPTVRLIIAKTSVHATRVSNRESGKLPGIRDYARSTSGKLPGLSLADAGLTFTVQIRFPSTMASRPESLVDHFLKSAGIAAVYVDADGAIGAVDVIGIDAPPGCILLCCAPGKQNSIAARAAARITAGKGSAGPLAALRAAAADSGASLTPHLTVIQRACAAVEMVEAKIAALQQSGDLKELNAEFKGARKAGTCARYQDFLHAKKMAMLEAIAQRR